ncbi:DUF664 domain-containing protein [uncultured Phycicoccus sp.]|uniref:mycothiol transferase n=1 Tax=uncultured Phycicoccus sp. TaxID=661422 RepID=UPI002622A36B|nr:DUF664 domain-containing protein [uncultured Phycicoccus sp.]
MISTEEYLRYCDAALDQYAAVCRELGDDLVNARLDDVAGSNSAFALVAHVVGVMARWGRTVNRGILVPRDRDAEFTATGTLDDALDLLARGRAALHEDVHAASPHDPPADPPDGEDVGTQGAVLLHVYEELAQHLGQLEVTRDVLLSRRG